MLTETEKLGSLKIRCKQWLLDVMGKNKTLGSKGPKKNQDATVLLRNAY